MTPRQELPYWFAIALIIIVGGFLLFGR